MQRQVSGTDLKVGDVIEVWWKPGKDTITKLEPYRGNLEHLFPEGASIAKFAILTVGMTIDHQDHDFTVLNRESDLVISGTAPQFTVKAGTSKGRNWIETQCEREECEHHDRYAFSVNVKKIEAVIEKARADGLVVRTEKGDAS